MAHLMRRAGVNPNRRPARQDRDGREASARGSSTPFSISPESRLENSASSRSEDRRAGGQCRLDGQRTRHRQTPADHHRTGDAQLPAWVIRRDSSRRCSITWPTPSSLPSPGRSQYAAGRSPMIGRASGSFEVQDTGIGIAADVLPSCSPHSEQAGWFNDPRVWRDRPRTGDAHRKLAEQMGGGAGVESMPVRGVPSERNCQAREGHRGGRPGGNVRRSIGRDSAAQTLRRATRPGCRG